jgi:hypothetical protein
LGDAANQRRARCLRRRVEPCTRTGTEDPPVLNTDSLPKSGRCQSIHVDTHLQLGEELK